MTVTEPISETQKQQMIKLTTLLVNHHLACWIRNPPDSTDTSAQIFAQLLPRPICLKTILEDVVQNKYNTIYEWESDIHLLLNTVLSTPRIEAYHKEEARILLKKFEKRRAQFTISKEKRFLQKSLSALKELIEIQKKL
jgi:hypothetical protein